MGGEGGCANFVVVLMVLILPTCTMPWCLGVRERTGGRQGDQCTALTRILLLQQAAARSGMPARVFAEAVRRATLLKGSDPLCSDSAEADQKALLAAANPDLTVDGSLAAQAVVRTHQTSTHPLYS